MSRVDLWIVLLAAVFVGLSVWCPWFAVGTLAVGAVMVVSPFVAGAVWAAREWVAARREHRRGR